MWLRQKEQGAAVCGRSDCGNGVDSQRRQRQGQATVAEAEAVQGQTTTKIAAETVLAAAEMAAAVAVAAAMATVAMVTTTRQLWQR